MIAFRQFLRKYGITLLPIGIQSTLPGDILKKEKRGYYPYTQLRKLGNLPDAQWKVDWTAAHVTQEKVSRSLSLKGKYSLRGMGVDIGGGLSKAKSATYTISGVKAKQLVKLDILEVEALLEGIKRQKKGTWRKIRGNHFVELTFYATEFTIDFEVDGNIDLKGEVGDGLSHEAGTSVKWTKKTRLKVSQNDQIPFGFKRMRIR